ncbi:MAG: YbbR-like domain-containing protein [Anaerolineales bacterium]|jgi:YbbR domain-containing protein
MMRAIRWLSRNLSAFILAFILAVAVWISAVTATDPNQERTYTIPVETLGQEANTEIIGSIPDRMQLTLYAPSSNLDLLSKDNSALQAWIDLSGLGEGMHQVPVQYQIPSTIRPVRFVSQTPTEVEIKIENIITATIPILTEVRGTPSLGYQAETPEWDYTETVVSGRSSLVNQVTHTEAVLDISGVTETIEQTFVLIPRDDNGKAIAGVQLNPERVTVVQPITLMGGYRNMVIKVMTTGQVADGYRQTNITVTPPNVMVFSADPALLDQLPGFVETETLDLTGATDDVETVLALNLPEGISVIGDNRVLVLVGVAAIEGSITLSLEVEVIGLLPGLDAQVAPASVDVIVAGPIPDLESISPVDVRVVVDVTGLEIGTYQIQPTVDILPDRIYLQSISPETVEVTIQEQPTPTITSTPDAQQTPTP